MSEAYKTQLPSVTLTIHECSVCGHLEGESPQAGCCPNCGTASDPIPVKVKRV